MPIPERPGPEISEGNARLLEVITKRRRQQRARRRRQLIVLGATAGMGLIVGLALMTEALRSFNRSPAQSRSATVVAPPPVRSTPAPQAPAGAAGLAEPPPASLPERAVEFNLSQPIAARPPESGFSPSGPADEPPAESDPARRTASWLIQTYGRLEAENRALIVAEFYSGERRAFWQRVLADVRQKPER